MRIAGRGMEGGREGWRMADGVGWTGRAPNHTTIVVFIFVAEAIFTIIIISSWLLRFNLPTVGTWERER